MSRFKTYVLAFGVVALGALAGALAGDANRPQASAADQFLTRFGSLLSTVMAHAPKPVEASELVYSAIDGTLEMLDPHSNFLRPEMFSSMRERQQGSFHGIGVIISMRGGRVTIVTPIEGTPAARLGLRAGDVIDKVDDQSTEGMNLDDVARRLRGLEGTTVRVTIIRPGLQEPLELAIQRGRVPTDSVRYAFMIGSDTAYIRVNDFTRTTGREFRTALEKLLGQGATRLVLDLRQNPGGIVDSAVEVAGVLLAPGQRVFSTRGRTADSFQDYRASRDGLHFDGPLVVLINTGSASAAEIVAGAVQDHDRGLVVGETSFGKGVVQTIYPVRDAGLALTTAKYYTPSGRCIQRDFDSYFAYTHPERDGDEGETVRPRSGEEQGKGEAFFTDAGRKVYGSGGIVPDYQVAQGEYSARIVRLLANSAFFHFAVEVLAGASDKEAAARAFVVDDSVIARFRAMALAKEWSTAEELDAALADPTDRRDIAVQLRTEVLNAGVSLNEGYRAAIETDAQLQDALGRFDEAAQLHARATAATRPAQQAKLPPRR
ncbi:MAG: S41 family peptidase [Acidobacteriota bacterium]|jgi:carboxyl-terminal processing protease